MNSKRTNRFVTAPSANREHYVTRERVVSTL